ncbi:DUF397 domain-containing protein [Streptomyces sp. NRRL F-5126]|uniref:DUF397 domain-containing protein n=1 Tax=Streptomyces sp. NRRL F-5126 TaxID=1463857 RepID=UPI000AA7C85D|nr:DUF397 domain-containing protein [Streptomyces sp. NRRL F-5126]
MPAPRELDPSASLAALYGAKLRKLCVRAGLTQRQFGDGIPIAHSRIAQFELGKEVPPEDVNGKLDLLLDADGDLVDLWGHVRRTPFPDWARKYMSFANRAGVAYVESSHSGELVETQETVAEYVLAFGHLRAQATLTVTAVSRREASAARWRKSSYSNTQGGDCVEVAEHIPDVVPVRDSKNPAGPALLIPKAAWSAFVRHLRHA